MDYLPRLVAFALNAYFYLILIKYLLDYAGSRSSTNKFVYYVNRFTQPYLIFVTSRCRGTLAVYSSLIALLILIWAEYFIPDTISYLISPMAENSSVFVVIPLIFLSSVIAVFRSILFFFGILSLIYFILLMSRSPLNNPITSSIMIMVEPMLSPLRKLFPFQKNDISPLILCVICFMSLYFVLPALSSYILSY